jgi:hypothetical protein
MLASMPKIQPWPLAQVVKWASFKSYQKPYKTNVNFVQLGKSTSTKVRPVQIVSMECTKMKMMFQLLYVKVVAKGSTRQQKKSVAVIVQKERFKKFPQYFMNAPHAQLDSASTQQDTPETPQLNQIAKNAPLGISEVILRGMSMTMLKGELELFNHNLEWPYASDVFLGFTKIHHIKLGAKFVQQKRLILKKIGPQNVSIAQLEK